MTLTIEDWKDRYYEQQALHTEAQGMLAQERDGYKRQRDEALAVAASRKREIEHLTAALDEAVAVFRGFRAGCAICDDEGHELDWRDIDRRCDEIMAKLGVALSPPLREGGV